VNDRTHDVHLSAEQVQAFLDRALPAPDAAKIEQHLQVCERCASEMHAWQVLFADLGAMSHHSSLTPSGGFADRVMAQVAVPGPGTHIPMNTLQEFLDEMLDARHALRVEEHVRACPPCTAEADHWLALTRRLDEIGSFAPSDGFSDRVMARVEVRHGVTWASRLLGRAGARPRASAAAHVPWGILQDFVDDVLPAKGASRVVAHLDACAGCRDQLRSWLEVAARLDALERHAPSPGFHARVLATSRAGRTAHALATPTPLWARAAATASKFIPKTRESWAALTGVAFTPAVIAGLAAWVVFSHPAVTVASLASFVWWQVADLASMTLAGVPGILSRGWDAAGARALFEALAAQPLLMAGAVLLYSALCALAARVLHRILFSDRSPRDRRPHVTFAS
jgi:hypothetical protein